MIWMGPDKLHDVPTFHPIRDDRKMWGLQQDTNKWYEVIMSKPFPPNGLFEDLRV